MFHVFLPVFPQFWTENISCYMVVVFQVVHLYQKLLTGMRKAPPRWQFCAEITHKFFGHLLNSLLHRWSPQLFWACSHRWWSGQGADEGVGSAGVRGSEDLRRTSSGCLVSGTCTQSLAQAQAQAVSSQVIAHKVFQPGRRLSLFTFLYISCVHQASFYVSPLFLCLRL